MYLTLANGFRHPINGIPVDDVIIACFYSCVNCFVSGILLLHIIFINSII